MTLKDYLHPANVKISEETDEAGVASFQVKEHSTGKVYLLDEKIYEFFANSPLIENLKIIVNDMVQKRQPSDDEVIKAYQNLMKLDMNFKKAQPVEQ
jgi:hypothetical protein